ncbi:hypothetical protein GCM10023324_42750 [Streptomyces youssoufiensis]
MLYQGEVHAHQAVAEFGPLRRTVGELAQLYEHRSRAASVLWIVGPLLVLVLIHVVRPLWSVAGRLRVRGMRPVRLLRDGRGAHPPR